MSEKIFFEITEYYNDKDSAVALTFDDAWIESWKVMTDYVADKDIPLTFYINTFNMSPDDIEFYKKISQQGHEIGYHTQYHTDMRELNDCEIMEDIIGWCKSVSKFYNVHDCLTMSYPYGYRPKNLNHIVRNFIAGRSTMLGLNDKTPKNIHRLKVLNIGKRSSLEKLNDTVDSAIKEKGILVEAGHGLNKEGWSPIPQDILFNHLDYLKSKDNIWIATMKDIAKYVSLRDNYIISTSFCKNGVSHYILNFIRKDNYMSNFYPIPLTIKIIGYRKVHWISQNGRDLEVFMGKDNIQYFSTKDFINPVYIYI